LATVPAAIQILHKELGYNVSTLGANAEGQLHLTCCIIFRNFKPNCVRFEVFIVVDMKITVFWHETQCRLVERYQHF
jgi:hypothetical protein